MDVLMMLGGDRKINRIRVVDEEILVVNNGLLKWWCNKDILYNQDPTLGSLGWPIFIHTKNLVYTRNIGH